MNDVTVQRLGHRIREIRLQRGMTLQEVAASAGFSKGLLSKVETGVVSPPIATLAKLADALHIGVGEFFEGAHEDESVCYFPREKRGDARGRLSAYNYKYEPLVSGRSRREMQPMIITADGKTCRFKLMDHPGEQFIYMLEGEMDYVLGDKTYTVRPEDCLYFDARKLHGPKMKKNQKARYLVVFTQGSHRSS